MTGICGFYRGLCASVSLGLTAALALGPDAAHARETRTIALAATTLPEALAQVARQTGIEIVSLDPEVGLVPVGARVLPAEPEAALKAVLRGTGYGAVRVGPRSFRIVRDRPNARRTSRPLPPASEPGEAITVIGGKFPTGLQAYPGSVVRMPGGEGPELNAGQLANLGWQTPVVFATAFGDGRDKIFIRGIADSSFNGASQPTTAIYFDDAPLSFGSPNPNLRLYDVAAVEVLEGPQGTLFGAGSIGGVIRLVPEAVDLARPGGMATAEGEVLDGGGVGWKLGGALNLPIVRDRAGLRLVGFTERAAGYISDPVLGSNINVVDVSGGRGALAFDLGPGWRIDASALYQQTRAADAQYAEPGRGGASHDDLMRRAALAQPYRNELVLGRVALRRSWDSGLELASVFSVGHRSSFDRFDATGELAGATVYDQQRSSRALTNETRIGRQVSAGLSWVMGVNLQEITDGQSRAFGMPTGARALDEVTNRTRSASVYVQGRLPLWRSVEATMGLRYTVARTDSEPARGNLVSYVRGDPASHFDPTVALLWRANPRLSLFARYQTGYRNGGVTVARGIGRVSDFHPDTIAMVEAGLRRRRIGPTGLELSAAISQAWWNDVLAELVTPRGTPITGNTGNARLLALEGEANWVGRSGWRAGASLLYADNRLSGELAGQSPLPNRRLPDTPQFSARVHGGREWRAGGDLRLSLDGYGRYVGRSVLGPGALLDRSQGDYTVIDLRAGARRGRVEGWLAVDNLLDNHANRFALGNPLLLYRREGYVPLAPRRISIGFQVTY